MTDNQFDNFFREKLKDHTAPVPQGLWEKIRPEKEKRPKGFFLPKINGTGLMVAALLVGTVLIGLFTYQQHSSVPDTDAAALNQNKTNTTNNSSSNLNSNPSEKNSTLAPVSNNSISTKETNNEISNATLSTTIIQNNSKAQNAKPVLNQTNAAAISNANEILMAPVVSNNNATENKSAESANNAFDEPNYVSAHIKQGAPFFFETASTTGTVQKNLAANGHDKFIKSTIIICPTDRSKSSFNSDWGLEVFASPDYSLKSVTNVSASQQYLDKKDSSEQMQIGYTAGFRLVKPLNKNLLLKTGFQYSQMNQKFSYRNENEIKTTTVITTRSIIRSPGDTIIVNDTSTLQQVGFSVKTIHNRYRSIDIPLTLGYQFGNDDLSIGINAGVIFNLSSWYQGEILDTSLASVPMSKVSNEIYKSKLGMGLYSSISVLKRINENTQLFFEPYFRYNLSDMTNAQSPYNQRFHVGGLAVGLRFSLNNR
jgi:cytoskeletal protein RodZ